MSDGETLRHRIIEQRQEDLEAAQLRAMQCQEALHRVLGAEALQNVVFFPIKRNTSQPAS